MTKRARRTFSKEFEEQIVQLHASDSIMIMGCFRKKTIAHQNKKN